MSAYEVKRNIFIGFIMLLAAIFIFVSATSFAFASDGTLSEKNQFNNTIAYMVITAVSFFLLLGYCAFIKKKELVFILLFTSVFLINLGYTFLSASLAVSEALLANKLSYIGAVFLPLFMLVIIMDQCNYKRCKPFLSVLLCINVAVLLLVLSPGYSTLYYEDVSLTFVNGGAVLFKVYGPLHGVYTYFLALYFLMMFFFIIRAWLKKTISSPRVAISLLLVVLLNILVWLIEQKIHFNFEFLSISYILTELYLLSTYGMMFVSDSTSTDNLIAVTPAEQISDDDFGVINFDKIIEDWPAAKQLTTREIEVLKELIVNKKRKEIADELCVSENTVKKHTSNIFAKLGVSSRAEIIELLAQKK